MKEQEQAQAHFPFGLTPEDRLNLQMLVVDEDNAEAGTMLNKYGIPLAEGVSPLDTCKQWFRLIQGAEQHHCQNILDLHSQGKSIGGMQALATSIRKEAP